MTFLGIDPGLHGGIAVAAEGKIEVFPMPILPDGIAEALLIMEVAKRIREVPA